MTDCIIVGSGVAAISAALTLKANGKSFILLGEKSLSEKIRKAERIDNYPALNGVTGEEFAKLLKEQLESAGIEIIQARVTGVYAMKDKFTVAVEGGNVYEGRTVILASGVETGKRIEGETEFLGRGVSYCATCDGFLYKGKRIAVVCLSKKFEHEAKYLAELAEKIYYFPLYKNAEFDGEKIEKIIKMPTKISGTRRVEKITVGEREIEVDGVFLLKESLPPENLVFGVETEGSHVKISRDGATNLKGLFAAGDVTGRPYQYAKAVGEGNVAAHSVTEYLNTMNG